MNTKKKIYLPKDIYKSILIKIIELEFMDKINLILKKVDSYMKKVDKFSNLRNCKYGTYNSYHHTYRFMVKYKINSCCFIYGKILERIKNHMFMKPFLYPINLKFCFTPESYSKEKNLVFRGNKVIKMKCEKCEFEIEIRKANLNNNITMIKNFHE